MRASHSRDLSDEERRAILLRDKYRCTETVMFKLDNQPRRCAVVGSEMVVRDGRAMCPRHAREWEAQNACSRA